ncbi:YbfB/YjiJ family MFS transporter [Kitasatospora sp. NPDC093102]|uniref:YbfB/YjiJ family MFS transporter n=1 Tax=Kitasatospora sp. NPDC093102 TaxID=3155069 RepID=UPI0034147F7E
MSAQILGQKVAVITGASQGIGAGIALSGLLVLVLRSMADWRTAWWAAAGLTAVCAAASWNLRPAPVPAPVPRNEAGDATAGTHRRFTVLLTAYTLEGIGYIIAGTFLVFAIDQSAPGWAGSSAWILVGLAAVPSSALWARLARRWSHPALLVTALVVQAVGIALPALTGSVAPALLSALLFGGTFIGVSALALATGARMRQPRSVALLTGGYSVGQLLGPPVVAPLLHHGYHQALLLAAGIALAAALAAVTLCLPFSKELDPRRS